MRKLASSLLVALALIVPLLYMPAATAASGTAPAVTKVHKHPKAKHHRHKHHKRKAHRHKHHKRKAHRHKHAHKRPKRGGNTRVWDRLAQCESGGRWHINTGNGYYGGVQISPSTWRAFGGARYAGLPHKATKKEQIKVAERIKRGQGWGAWPSCSRRIGVR